MSIQLRTRQYLAVLIAVIFCGLLILLLGQSIFAINTFAQGPTTATPMPFLYPPFPGIAAEISLFDHQSPNNVGPPFPTPTPYRNGFVVVFNGQKANCQNGKTNPCYYGNNIHADYDNHEGFDFDTNYRPIFAAADSNKVLYAGWSNPQNHSSAFGLHIRLEHITNGHTYNTLYAHLSTIPVTPLPLVEQAKSLTTSG